MQEFSISPSSDASLQTLFSGFVGDAAFPCVGAKSALGRGQVTLVQGGAMGCPRSDATIVKAIQQFVADCPADRLFTSLVVVFKDEKTMPEEQFESLLWQRLQAFHSLDSRDFAWDETVSSDPESADFSMSLGGAGFYVVGLHPGSSRPARRFPRPAMVFNLHRQFEQLREEGTYARLREAILKRDLAANGSINPMLAVHGERSEAAQYSGRHSGEEWKCPFAPSTGMRHAT